MDEKNDVINVVVNKEIKDAAVAILKEKGISMTDAITLYLKEVIKYNGIPFRIELNPVKSNSKKK